jgi:hypothetical protein
LGGVHEVYRVFPDFMEKFLKDGAVFYVAIWIFPSFLDFVKYLSFFGC